MVVYPCKALFAFVVLALQVGALPAAPCSLLEVEDYTSGHATPVVARVVHVGVGPGAGGAVMTAALTDLATRAAEDLVGVVSLSCDGKDFTFVNASGLASMEPGDAVVSAQLGNVTTGAWRHFLQFEDVAESALGFGVLGVVDKAPEACSLRVTTQPNTLVEELCSAAGSEPEFSVLPVLPPSVVSTQLGGHVAEPPPTNEFLHHFGEGNQVFAELKANALARIIPGMSMILDPVMNTVLKPILDILCNMLAPTVLSPISDQAIQDMKNQVPGDVAAMLGSTVEANLTNLLIDGVGGLLAESLSKSLTQELGDALVPAIADRCLDSVKEAVSSNTGVHVAGSVRFNTVHSLHVSLLASLTKTLAESVPHAIVPTIAAVLNPQLGPRRDATSLATLYSSYYTEYYASFYSAYYNQAMAEVITVRKAEWEELLNDMTAEAVVDKLAETKKLPPYDTVK